MKIRTNLCFWGKLCSCTRSEIHGDWLNFGQWSLRDSLSTSLWSSGKFCGISSWFGQDPFNFGFVLVLCSCVRACFVALAAPSLKKLSAATFQLKTFLENFQETFLENFQKTFLENFLETFPENFEENPSAATFPGNLPRKLFRNLPRKLCRNFQHPSWKLLGTTF